MKRALENLRGDVASICGELRIPKHVVARNLNETATVFFYKPRLRAKTLLDLSFKMKAMLRDMGWVTMHSDVPRTLIVEIGDERSVKSKSVVRREAVQAEAKEAAVKDFVDKIKQLNDAPTIAVAKRRFRDVPQYPTAHYEVDVFWHHLENWVTTEVAEVGLQLDPDFQRGHVWSEDQQRAYVEHCLKGGEAARQLIFNADNWPNPAKNYTLVDGKQRLEAVRKFLRDELDVFRPFPGVPGSLRSGYGDSMPFSLSFRVRVCKLDTRADVLKLYLSLNAGGTPHSMAEIRKVRLMLAQEERPTAEADQDVHTEHCCLEHGCKYANDEEGHYCPVESGKKVQSHLCEWCDSSSKSVDDDQ